MEQVIEVQAAAKAEKSDAGSVSIPTLLRESCAQLDARFAAARWTGPVTLEGHPTGHLLAVPGYERGLGGNVIAIAQRRWVNPWQGKSFRTLDDGAGTGTNRIRLLGLRFGAFRFKTYAAASLVDGKPVFVIDYNTPQTPEYARATYDELRPIAPNVFLGRGMKQRSNKGPKLLCWFLLDLTQPDVPVQL